MTRTDVNSSMRGGLHAGEAVQKGSAPERLCIGGVCIDYAVEVVTRIARYVYLGDTTRRRQALEPNCVAVLRMLVLNQRRPLPPVAAGLCRGVVCLRARYYRLHTPRKCFRPL